MRGLTDALQQYVLAIEWDKLVPGAISPPTTWHIRVQTGEQMLVWSSLRDQIEADKRIRPEERARQLVDLDTDLFVAAIAKVEDWEADDGKLETTNDPKRIREIINRLGKGEREELGLACVMQARLSVGEPTRLRSQLTSRFGEESSQPASATTTANGASGSAITEAGSA